MNIPPEFLVAIAVFIVNAAFTAGIVWANARATKDEIRNIWDQIQKCRKWESEHEKDSNTVRLEIEKTFGEMRSSLAVGNGQFSQILIRLEKIDGKIDKLETREERNT